MTYTAENKKRITKALRETEGLLNKELAFSEELQKKDMVYFYQSHIVKLNNMLAS